MKRATRYPAPPLPRAADPERDLRRAIRDLDAAEASATGRRLELIKARKARLAARLGRLPR
jgi:hypothetical protein